MSPTFLWKFMILDYCCIGYQVKYFFLLFPLKRLRTLCNGVALNQDTPGMKWGMKMPVLDAWKTGRDIPVAVFHRTNCSYFCLMATALSSSCCPGQLLRSKNPWHAFTFSQERAHKHQFHSLLGSGPKSAIGDTPPKMGFWKFRKNFFTVFSLLPILTSNYNMCSRPVPCKLSEGHSDDIMCFLLGSPLSKEAKSSFFMRYPSQMPSWTPV